MTKLNKDGLAPGQPATWADMVAANAKRQATPTDTAPKAITREGIADMVRKDVISYLETHGVTKADCKDVDLADLRDMLISAVFVDL